MFGLASGANVNARVVTGLAIALALCLAFSIVAPVFDADVDETWQEGFARYILGVWKWLLAGAGWAVLVATVSIYKA